MRTNDRTEEQVLIMRAQRGELPAFRTLVERHAPMAYSLALRMTCSSQSAANTVQAAFLSAWRSLPKFLIDANFAAHICGLIINAVKQADAAPANDTQTEQSDKEIALQRSLIQLSANHRAILLLREVGGLSFEEISAILELTAGTVESRLARAMQEIQEKTSQDNNIQQDEIVAALRCSPELPGGLIEQVMSAVDGVPQDIPFTNLPQDRDVHAAGKASLKAWRKPIIIVAALIAVCLLILGLGSLAQNLNKLT